MLGQSKSKRSATASRLASTIASRSPARKMRLLRLLVSSTIRLDSHLETADVAHARVVTSLNWDAPLYTVGYMSCQVEPSLGGRFQRVGDAGDPLRQDSVTPTSAGGQRGEFPCRGACRTPGWRARG